MYLTLKKNFIKFYTSKEASALVEFSLVVGLFIFLLLSSLELLLLRSYVTFVETAINRGFERAFDSTSLKTTTDDNVVTYNRLDPNNIIRNTEIIKNIPKVLQFFTGGMPEVKINQVLDYNQSNMALHSQKTYECIVVANWIPFSPYLQIATKGQPMRLQIKKHFNDY